MRRLPAFMLLFAALASTSVFANNLTSSLRKTVDSDNRNFEALMPSNTKSVYVPHDENDKNQTLLDSYWKAKGSLNGSMFEVKAQYLTLVPADKKLRKQAIEAYGDSLRESMEKQFGAPQVDESSKQHGMLTRTVVCRVVDNQKRQLLYSKRVMFDGKRMYYVTHLGPLDATSKSLGQQFMDSVKPLQPPTK